MKKTVFLITSLVFVSLIACSKTEQAQQQPAASAQQSAPVQQEQQPAPTPQTAATNPTPGAGGSNQLPKNGKVAKAMHAGGYTYMQIEKDGKEFWIAATMMNVKKDDYVRWGDAAVMKNFSSSTLHRTFDEILFVTDATLDQ